jgi:hypothetical protein
MSAAMVASVLTGAIVSATVLSGRSLEAAGEEITLCHKGHALTVSSQALEAHLDHGDSIDACATPTETPTTTPQPDLVVVSVTFTPAPESENRYVATIRNIGTGVADLGGIAVQGYYSADATIDDSDTRLCLAMFLGGVSLAEGETVDLEVDCAQVPLAGQTNLLVFVDAQGSLTESSETNNVAAFPLPID